MLKDYTHKLITGMLLQELHDGLGDACVDKATGKIWLKKSLKAHSFLSKNEDKEYYNISMNFLYFLRCSYFWFNSNKIAFNIEVKTALTQFNDSPLFSFLHGLVYLHSFVSLQENKISSFDPQMLKIIKNTEICFTLSEKNQLEEDYLSHSLLWFRAWFAYKLKRQDVMEILANKAVEKDKGMYGEGWLFFIRWLSEIADPADFIIMLNTFNINKSK